MGKDKLNTCYFGGALELAKRLPDESIHCIVTSPPYWGLRDYGMQGEIGLEETLEEYIDNLIKIFGELKRALKNGGTLWLVLGDTYARNPKKGEKFRGKSKKFIGHNRDCLTSLKIPKGCKPKDLIGLPWRVAFALQTGGWYLRSDICWSKPNPMPEPVRDRPTKAHEYLFLLSKSERYYYDIDAIREPHNEKYIQNRSPESFSGTKDNKHRSDRRCSFVKRYSGRVVGNPLGRNKRSVWTITTKPFKGAHFAVFPPDLIDTCILAGSKPGDIVLDPFFGAGTTGLVCEMLGRRWLGFELNPEYKEVQEVRLAEKEKWIEKKLGKKKCNDPVERHIMQYLQTF